MKKIEIKEQGNCKVVIVPEGVCTIKIKGLKEGSEALHWEEGGLVIENISRNMKCQKTNE